MATLPTAACAQQPANEREHAGLEPHTAAKLTRAIPKSGEQVPIIGLGTWQSFDIAPGGEDWAEGRSALDLFLRSGGRIIDSSPMYGRAEEAIGAMLAELKGLPKPFLATKVWTSGREAGRAQIEESFRQLRSPVIDLLQVHNLLDFDTHLDTLKELKSKAASATSAPPIIILAPMRASNGRSAAARSTSSSSIFRSPSARRRRGCCPSPATVGSRSSPTAPSLAATCSRASGASRCRPSRPSSAAPPGRSCCSNMCLAMPPSPAPSPAPATRATSSTISGPRPPRSPTAQCAAASSKRRSAKAKWRRGWDSNPR